ncbi:hypothetical protein [Streptomyces phaeofaciens]
MRFLDSRPEGLYRIKGYVDFGAAPRRRPPRRTTGRRAPARTGGRPPGGPRRPTAVGTGRRSSSPSCGCTATRSTRPSTRSAWAVP